MSFYAPIKIGIEDPNKRITQNSNLVDNASSVQKIAPDQVMNVVVQLMGSKGEKSFQDMFYMSQRDGVAFLADKSKVDFSDKTQALRALFLFSICREDFGENVKVEITFDKRGGATVTIRQNDNNGNSNALVAVIELDEKELKDISDGKLNKANAKAIREKVKNAVEKKLKEKGVKILQKEPEISSAASTKTASAKDISEAFDRISSYFSARVMRDTMEKERKEQSRLDEKAYENKMEKRREEKIREKKILEKIENLKNEINALLEKKELGQKSIDAISKSIESIKDDLAELASGDDLEETVMRSFDDISDKLKKSGSVIEDMKSERNKRAALLLFNSN